MSNSFLDLQIQLLRLTGPILECLNKTHYTPEESSNVSTREILDSLLPNRSFEQNPNITEHEIRTSIKHFALACALLSSSQSSTHELLSWIPKNLSDIAESAFREISRGYIGVFGERNANRIGKFGLDCGLLSEEKRFLVELMPEILPGLKERIKESSIDKSDENNEFTAASARVPVVYAILCAYQFRWFVTQVDHPYLGKLCNMVIPCALTALDHWSPEVKGQGMIIFTYLAKNVNATEFGCYQDVILDACCQNIACSDEIWHHVAEMSALLVTSIQKNNPRSSWFEKILNEMLSHLERQPRNKDRRVAWLRSIEPLFSAVGLVLLAHFRRLFPLFFKWMHVDDDETVLLVLKRVHTVLRLTWIRNTPYIERLVDELVVLYKEAALKKGCEEIRTEILRVLSLLKQCKGLQFEAAWDKHREDPNLSMLHPSLSSGRNVQTQRSFAENAHEGGSEPLRAQ